MASAFVTNLSRYRWANFVGLSSMYCQMHRFSTVTGTAMKGVKERAGKALKPGGARYRILLMD
jgi:hypothetical protein